MATRRPLVIIDGVVQEIAVADDLPADCIPGGGGGGGTDINGMAFTDADTSTVTSGLVNYNTLARTYTFPDKSGTVAMMDDIPATVNYVFPVMGTVLITIGLTDSQAHHENFVSLPGSGMSSGSNLIVQLVETDDNGDDEIHECSLSAVPGLNGFTYSLSSNGPIFGQFRIGYCFYNVAP